MISIIPFITVRAYDGRGNKISIFLYLLAFDRDELREAFRFGHIMMMKIGQVIRERFEDLHMEILAERRLSTPRRQPLHEWRPAASSG
ncbi:MAG TPA: hypothetical protein EYP25_11340 [Anaerolineae bacterium]|nr:hypothetical protein [Anaerolineae bacterium]